MEKPWLHIGIPAGIAAVSLLILSLADGDSSGSRTTKGGVKITDVKEGKGAEAKKGDTVVVHYTGTLKDGTKFDSSLDRDEPIDFKIGAGNVIKGWDEGIVGMKEGGQRKLIIPPEMGYGKTAKGKIPPDSELHFNVELLAVNPQGGPGMPRMPPGHP